MKKQIITALAAYPKAIHLIFKNKMGKYLLVPALLNILLVIALVILGAGIGDWINDSIKQSVENMNGWIKAAMVAIQIILPLVFFIVFIFIGGTIVTVLMSPIYTLLSEKAETILTGKTFESTVRQTLKDIGRALLIAIRSTAKQLILTLLCLLLNFIPVVGSALSLILIFIINAYYFGFGFMDYTFERWRIPAKESRQKTHKLKYVAIANGALYSLPLYLFCGAFIAAFIGGISTVAATIAQMEMKEE